MRREHGNITDYIDLDYVQPNGWVAINTGLTLGEGTNKVVSVIKMYCLANSNTELIASSYDGNLTTDKNPIQYYKHNNGRIYNQSASIVYSTILNKWVTITFETTSANRKLSTDTGLSNSYPGSATPINTGSVMYIFGRSPLHPGVKTSYNARYRRWKIYVNDVLVRDYVPKFDVVNNLAGMYDLVNDYFNIDNEGTGKFLYE